MKEVFSAFHADVFRPMVSLLIPGALAGSSWFFVLLWKYPVVLDLVTKNHTETAFVLVLVMIAIGLICENVGSRIEIIFDHFARQSDPAFDRVWFSYLRTAYVAEPIGRRYLRTVVLRLKFELGSAVGIIIADFGLFWLWHLGLPWQRTLGLGVASLLLVGYLLWESKSTHQLLAETRREMVGPITVIN